MSTFPTFPSPASPAQMAEGPPPVLLVAPGPAPQRRLTVLFRLFMVIPHGIVLYFLAIGAVFTMFIGWWAALFAGRLPAWAQSYLTGFQRWTTRVTAYAMLLTDVYPPFSLQDEPDYPVRIAIPPREELNRLAVFFRFILVIPVYLLTQILLFGGVTIVAFIAWLIVLFTGRLPEGLHQAYAATLRFQLRTQCYQSLLTPAYPSRLFGDDPAAADLPAAGYLAPPGAPAPAADWGPVADPAPAGYETPGGYDAPGGYGMPGGYDAPAAYGAPAYGAPAYGAPAYGAPAYGAPGYGAPGGYGAPASYGTPADWRLFLTAGARRLLVLFIVLGAVLYIAEYGTSYAINASNAANTTQNAYDRISAANGTLTTQLTSWQQTVQSCADMSCINTADAQAATDFANFASTLHGTSMPAAAVGPANQLYADATTIAGDMTKLSKVTDGAQYQSTVASTGLKAALNRFDTDISALGNVLTSS